MKCYKHVIKKSDSIVSDSNIVGEPMRKVIFQWKHRLGKRVGQTLLSVEAQVGEKSWTDTPYCACMTHLFIEVLITVNQISEF